MNKQYSDDLHSLSHTKWCCKYHVVFAPKYRRKAFYDSRRLEIGAILRQLCEWKGVKIIEAEVCVDHIHASRNSTQDECIGIYGVSKRKK